MSSRSIGSAEREAPRRRWQCPQRRARRTRPRPHEVRASANRARTAGLTTARAPRATARSRAPPVGTFHARGRRGCGMRIVVFGLAVSSSWGNGHATLWRALGRALGARGHQLVFFERDVPYYAAHRDGHWFPGITVELYADLTDLRIRGRRELASADVAMVTSFCPEGAAVCALVLDSPAAVRVFYDLDTPVTMAAL